MKKMLTLAAALACATLATPSSAATYTYNLSSGAVMKIDTTAMVGSIIGSDINATFSGAGLASFAGGFNLPTFGSNIAIDPTSTRIVGGTTYYANNSHQQMLELGNYPGMVGAGTNAVNLWSYWGTAACPTCNYLGDYITTAVSSSTGGTSVPEPGMLGLMGLGLAAVAFTRRRQTVKIAMKAA